MVCFVATRVIGKCRLCDTLIEQFDTYYILDDGSICHDYCFELSTKDGGQ